MILDYQNNRVSLQPQDDENFLKIQENTEFVFTEKISDGVYSIPYVGLPIFLACLKKIGYRYTLTNKLREFIASYGGWIKRLQNLKETTTTDEQSEFYRWYASQKFPFQAKPEQLQTVEFALEIERGIIGNGIGTGKTLTANLLANYLLAKYKIEKCLVLLPASLVTNYYQDYVKFFGKSNDIVAVHKQNPQTRREIYKHFMSKNDIKILIINYEKCLFDYDILKKIQNIGLLICDEFHYMKNFLSAERSINFFEMLENSWKPQYRLAMSGTPIENRLFDILPIFKMLSNLFAIGSQRFFEENFIKWEDFYIKIKYRGKFITKFERRQVGFKNHTTLKNLIRPFIIRKKLVLPVALYHHDIEISMPRGFIEEYEAVRDTHESGSRRFHALRQFLNAPDGTKDPKLDMFEEIVSQIDEDEKILVFSFYKCTARHLSAWAKSKNIPYLTLTGEDMVDPLKRVEEFKNSNARFLFCTDRINFGMNVQFCRYVLNYELPLKPSTLFQRIGRCYRTGQDKDVHVYNFYVTKSVEEQIKDFFDKKKEIIKKIYEELDYEEAEDLKYEQEMKRIEEEC